MANKDIDIRKISETKQKEETTRPEGVEIPVKIEVTPKPEMPRPFEVPKERVVEGVPAPELPSAPAITAPVAPAKSPVFEKIEDVLEEDLEEIYFQLPTSKQAEFAKKGEETATQIERLLGHVKVRVGKILELIKNWLRLIPGVNKYFLEQEAKIKTDKILKIKEEGGLVGNEQNKI